jgi:hypothetical protein
MNKKGVVPVFLAKNLGGMAAFVKAASEVV